MCVLAASEQDSKIRMRVECQCDPYLTKDKGLPPHTLSVEILFITPHPLEKSKEKETLLQIDLLRPSSFINYFLYD